MHQKQLEIAKWQFLLDVIVLAQNTSIFVVTADLTVQVDGAYLAFEAMTMPSFMGNRQKKLVVNGNVTAGTEGRRSTLGLLETKVLRNIFAHRGLRQVKVSWMATQDLTGILITPLQYRHH